MNGNIPTLFVTGTNPARGLGEGRPGLLARGRGHQDRVRQAGRPAQPRLHHDSGRSRTPSPSRASTAPSPAGWRTWRSTARRSSTASTTTGSPRKKASGPTPTTSGSSPTTSRARRSTRSRPSSTSWPRPATPAGPRPSPGTSKLDPPTYDPPCLQRLWFRLLDDEAGRPVLNMNAHWRSRDAYKAAYMNVFALTDLQRTIAGRVAERIGPPGPRRPLRRPRRQLPHLRLLLQGFRGLPEDGREADASRSGPGPAPTPSRCSPRPGNGCAAKKRRGAEAPTNMTTPAVLLTVLAAVSASATIVAETIGRKKIVYVFKPAATISLIVLAAAAPGSRIAGRLQDLPRRPASSRPWPGTSS